ncbi:MAG: hypothetical protein Q9190_003280 [Brigantiaea leucoxantha]
MPSFIYSAPLKIPFTEATELNSQFTSSNPNSLTRADKPHSTRLPSQPRIHLNTSDLASYLLEHLLTPSLDSFASHLWLLSTPSYANISSLHHQFVKGRTIILTEDPSLHLLWIHNRIFLKPLPDYLLSFSFWAFHFLNHSSPLPPESRREAFAAACGFVRTYAYLIRYQSDFDIAQRAECRLIPDGIKYENFCDFIAGFESLGEEDDSSVISPRYQFGEIRLSRLKIWAKILFHKITFERFYGHYGDYFARFYGPLLFIFGVFSVVLSAMQVELAVSSSPLSSPAWHAFNKIVIQVDNRNRDLFYVEGIDSDSNSPQNHNTRK